MGNCCNCLDSGKVEPVEEAEMDTKLNLTDEERQLVVSSWKRINYDFTSRGIRVFELLLRQPELKNLFPFRHLSGEALRSNALFRAHSSRFVQSVAAVIEEIESSMNKGKERQSRTDPLDHMKDWKIGQLLHSLGQSHSAFRNLSPALFKETGHKAALGGLLTVWQDDLGHAWTADVAKAWEKLFDAILTEMYRGLEMATNKKNGTAGGNHRASMAALNIRTRHLRRVSSRVGAALNSVLARIGGSSGRHNKKMKNKKEAQIKHEKHHEENSNNNPHHDVDQSHQSGSTNK